MAPNQRKPVGSEELRRVRDRELELRRLSGGVSCADCRRLKLKCDRKIPCSSCIRRSAEHLCPLGGRSQSTRETSSNSACYCSQRWKRKLALLSERIRTLEDALAVESEARGGSGSHPLLTEELLAIKQSIYDSEGENGEAEEQEDELSGAFGTLSIDESRAMRYLGPVAADTALLMEVLEESAPRSPVTSAPSDPGGLTRDYVHSSRSFPFAPLFLEQTEDIVFAQLLSYIPPFERATALYEAYFTNLSWFIAPVERSHFLSEIIPLFYPDRKPVLPGNIHFHHAHDLALLYILFACGAVADLTQNPVNDEAARYHTLAKTELGVRSIMHGASLTGIQTIFLLAAYDVFAGEKKSQEDAWKLGSLGCSMAAAAGLHRDPSRWGFDAKMTERRRRIFWEIYVADNWLSLDTGRPPTFRLCDIDCEFPSDILATIGADGQVIESVTHWKFRFVHDVRSEVCEKLTSARPLRYRDVLELDRKIREFAVHPLALSYMPARGGLSQDEELDRVYPLVTTWSKEESLMLVHRNFFARAVLEFPDDPMRSPFAASFLATFRSASAVIRICHENMHVMYPTVLRIWHVWSLCLLCGVIVGAVASLGSSVSFSNSAFVELERAIKLFETFEGHKVAKHGLPLLLRIRQKAMTALCQPQTQRQTSLGQGTLLPTIRKETDDADDELLILRGSTRVVERRSTALPPNSDSSHSFGGTGSYAEPLEKTSDFDRAFPHGDLLAAQGQRHSVPTEGNYDFRLPKTTAGQSSDGPQIPQDDPDAWLAELEGLFGPAAFLQTDNPAGSYSSPFMTDPNISYEPTNQPVPNPIGVTGMTGIDPQLPLDETASTGEWCQFMAQSGFSNTPPFDFALDSFAPFGNSATSESQSDLRTL